MPRPENTCINCKHFDNTMMIQIGDKEHCAEDKQKGLCRLRPASAGHKNVSHTLGTSFAVVSDNDGCSDWLPVPPV